MELITIKDVFTIMEKHRGYPVYEEIAEYLNIAANKRLIEMLPTLDDYLRNTLTTSDTFIALGALEWMREEIIDRCKTTIDTNNPKNYLKGGTE